MSESKSVSVSKWGAGLVLAAVAVFCTAQMTVRPKLVQFDRIQVGTNWIYFSQSTGRLESYLRWNGASTGRGWLQFRNDANPNTIIYFGSTAPEGNNAIYLMANGSVDGNTDPRVRFRFGSAANAVEVDHKERSLYYNSGDLGSLFATFVWWTDFTTLFLGTNNTPLAIRGRTITADSNFVAAASLSTSPVTVNVTADNQVVSTTNRSFIVLTSDAVATSRTIILTPSNIPGAELTILFSGANGAEMLDDQAQTGGGNTRLTGTLTFTDHDVVTLKFQGTDWRQATGLVAN